LETIEEEKPDIVIMNGDLLEAAAASKFEDELPHDLETEFKQSNRLLESVRKAAPKASLILIEGNHDYRLRRVGRIDKKIRRSIDFRERISEIKDGHWKLIPYLNDGKRGVCRVGQLTFVHGFESTLTSDRNECVRFAQPNGLVVRGHTHRPVDVTQLEYKAGVPLPYYYANTGTLGPMKPDYMTASKTNGWGRGILIAEASTNPRVQATVNWTARVDIFERAE